MSNTNVSTQCTNSSFLWTECCSQWKQIIRHSKAKVGTIAGVKCNYLKTNEETGRRVRGEIKVWEWLNLKRLWWWEYCRIEADNRMPGTNAAKDSSTRNRLNELVWMGWHQMQGCSKNWTQWRNKSPRRDKQHRCSVLSVCWKPGRCKERRHLKRTFMVTCKNFDT